MPLSCKMHVVGVTIGVDLAGLLGGTHGERRRWARAEWVGCGEGCSLSSRLRGLGERRELPQRGPGQSPGRKRIWHILKATERSFLYLYDKFWGGDNLH